ncbi:peptidase M23 [uncultured Bilophila sp.]|uniref:peptidase M23 n=1 Tax=uncultured Bilophila sp. TaxID=529385 RepID=UPI00267092D1|nr:peptidase M23 [uncultured Bilophila sp.]
MLLFDTGKKLEKAFTQEQFDALVEVLERREDRAATKEDLRETELRMQVEIEKVRAETEKIRSELKTDIEKIRAETERVRLEVRETEARLKADNEKVKYDLLKWQIGGWIALATIMAKGFGWLGF